MKSKITSRFENATVEILNSDGKDVLTIVSNNERYVVKATGKNKLSIEKVVENNLVSTTKLEREVHMLNSMEAAYNEVMNIKRVVCSGEHRCRSCRKNIKPGTIAITASHLIDKKRNTTYRYVIDNNIDNKDSYRFVPTRHWICLECANEFDPFLIISNTFVNKETAGDIISTEEFYEMTPVNRANILYCLRHKGLISDSEYNEAMREINSEIAYIDAIGIGQE